MGLQSESQIPKKAPRYLQTMYEKYITELEGMGRLECPDPTRKAELMKACEWLLTQGCSPTKGPRRPKKTYQQPVKFRK